MKVTYVLEILEKPSNENEEWKVVRAFANLIRAERETLKYNGDSKLQFNNMITYRVRSKFPSDSAWREEFWDITTLREAKQLLEDIEKQYPGLAYSIIKVEEI